MLRYKDIILRKFEELDRLMECEDCRDFFLMQVGMAELLEACGYRIHLEPEGYILEKIEPDQADF